MSRIRAFTLIELLIVIAIIAILGSATVVVLNPLELMRQGRDGTRINDTQNIEKALKLTLFNNPTLLDSLSPTNIYLSLPSGSCPSNPPTGYAYVCNAASANLTKIDGTGWIPLSLQNIASLPTDPNSNPNFYYAFVADPVSKTYVITSLLESEKQLKAAASKDGGTDPGRFEKGSVSLWSGASGLVGYWPMDGIVGSVVNGQTNGFQDLSGNGRNGTATNANGTGMNFVVGKISNAVQFDGVDDAITSSYIPNIGSNRLTISAWISPNGSGTYEISNQGQWDGGPWTGWRFQLSSNALNLKLGDGTSTTYAYSAGNIQSGVWQLVTATWDGSYIRIYQNGTEVGNISKSLTYSGNTDTYNIGKYAGSAYFFNGYIDDERVYNRALTADEIKAIYNAQK